MATRRADRKLIGRLSLPFLLPGRYSVQPLCQLWYRSGQHVVDAGGEDKFHAPAHGIGQLAQVFFVILGKDSSADARAASGQDFFLDAADSGTNRWSGTENGHIYS